MAGKKKVVSWRDSPGVSAWKRPVRPAVRIGASKPSQPRNSVSLLFYSYPPQLIAQWCRCTLAHAYRLKQGRTKPSPTLLRLFEHHARGRVLGAEWKGWTIRGDRLFDPEGNEFTQSRLRGYLMMLQYCSELARKADDRDTYWQLLERLA